MARRKKQNPFRTRYVYDPRSCARLKIHGPAPHGYIEAKSKGECEVIALAMNAPKGSGIRPHGGSRAYGSFGSPTAVHRGSAQHYTKQTRTVVKLARDAARRGDCRAALHYFGFAAWNAGMAVQERSHAGGPRRKLLRGGSNMGKIVLGLQNTVFNACKVR